MEGKQGQNLGFGDMDCEEKQLEQASGVAHDH